jgi:hypothetical protein
MSMITDRMVGEYAGYNMYKNDYGMYYFTQVHRGYFIKKSFDTIQDMKDYILTITEPNSL